MITSKIQDQLHCFRAALLLCLAALLAGCGGEGGDTADAGADAQLSRITVGTGPAGTLYNQMGVAVSSLLQRELDVPATARPFTGSSIYLPQIQRGELEFGVNLSVDLQAAYSGVPPYQQPMTNLRAAVLLTKAPFMYFVRGDSDIRSIADLRGRPVVTTLRSLASFDRVNAAVLGTGGIGFDDVEQVEVAGVPDAIRALVENRADSAGTILGIPVLREADATLSGGIRVLPLGENEATLDQVPGLEATTLRPGPSFVSVEEPTRATQFDVYLSTGTHLSADQVYEAVKTVHGNWTRLQQEQQAMGRIEAGQLVPENLIVPFHEGAVRYFREAGLWTEAHERRQSELLASP